MGGASRAATGDPRHLVCGEKTGRLDVDVLLEDERQLQEAFAGIGSGEDGLQDALRNFASNSFHVLLSALWGQAEEDQVMVESWEIGERRFEVHIGNLGLRGAEGRRRCRPGCSRASSGRFAPSRWTRACTGSGISSVPSATSARWRRCSTTSRGRPACRTWPLSTGRIRRVTTACATSSCSSHWRRPPRREARKASMAAPFLSGRPSTSSTPTTRPALRRSCGPWPTARCRCRSSSASGATTSR